MSSNLKNAYAILAVAAVLLAYVLFEHPARADSIGALAGGVGVLALLILPTRRS